MLTWPTWRLTARPRAPARSMPEYQPIADNKSARANDDTGEDRVRWQKIILPVVPAGAADGEAAAAAGERIEEHLEEQGVEDDIDGHQVGGDRPGTTPRMPGAGQVKRRNDLACITKDPSGKCQVELFAVAPFDPLTFTAVQSASTPLPEGSFTMVTSMHATLPACR